MIAKILFAASYPSAIFWAAGVSWLKLKPIKATLKKMVNTSPAEYNFSFPKGL